MATYETGGSGADAGQVIQVTDIPLGQPPSNEATPDPNAGNPDAVVPQKIVPKSCLVDTTERYYEDWSRGQE